jgi:pimeloyl-ACP methyl ester carboxylesterase
LSKTSAPPDADHGLMTVPHDRPPGKNGAGATEESSRLADGGHLFTCQEGPGDATRILLIHGSGSCTRTWDPVASRLTASHRVIRVDLLGHGRSDKPDGVDYGIPAQALRLAAALDQLEVGPAIVVGHSSGGYVSTALAERDPRW